MKLSEATFTVIDVETTGLDPNVDKIVEIGMVTIHPEGGRAYWEQLFNPRIPIPAIASGIHHLTNRDVEDASLLEEEVETIRILTAESILVAHQADFDRSFLPMLHDCPWICSKRLAMNLWPDAPDYKNQTLRYWLNLEIPNARVPHRALPDAVVTAEVFVREMMEYLVAGNPNDVDALIEFCRRPVTVKIMPFGKHFGKEISEIPIDYIDWALRNVKDLDSDLKFTLEQRMEAQKLAF